MKKARINRQIRADKLRVIAPQGGEQLGIMSLEEALKRAEEEGLDLVEVAPEAKPPVCRLMDYNKYKYEQTRRDKEARKKQHVTHLKEVRMRPKIGEHDYLFKLHNAEKFLRVRDKVKVTMLFRGRERQHQELGRELLERFAKDLEEVGAVEEEPKFEFGRMAMILAPKRGIYAKIEDQEGGGQKV